MDYTYKIQGDRRAATPRVTVEWHMSPAWAIAHERGINVTPPPPLTHERVRKLMGLK
jgi:hypothetical protein